MRTLLVHDHQLFRQSLEFLLADLVPGIVFLEAETCDAALEYAEGAHPELVLMYLHVPDANGMHALGRMRMAFGNSALVVLSGDDDPCLIRHAIEMGAAGFVPRSSTPQILVAALRLVLAGGTYLPPNMLRDEARKLPRRSEHAVDQDSSTPRLSSRQIEVLHKALLGKPNKVIARELQLSEGTIKAHLSASFRALGVQNRTEAVLAMARHGSLTIPSPGAPHKPADASSK